MRGIVIGLLFVWGTAALGQAAPAVRMTQAGLQAIIAQEAEDVKSLGNTVMFRHRGVLLVCISDEAADRMRIIAPIKALAEASLEEIVAAMHANFHSVLDARYAISEGVVYAAYIHPLSPLTREQVVAAMRQVAAAQSSFGTAYSGGGPVYRGN